MRIQMLVCQQEKSLLAINKKKENSRPKKNALYAKMHNAVM